MSEKGGDMTMDKGDRVRKKVRITGGIPRYIGRIGEILEPDEGGSINREGQLIRIHVAFENYWSRPDGMNAVEADDSTWLFEGEYEYV